MVEKPLYNEIKEDEQLPEPLAWENISGMKKPSNWADITVDKLEKILYYITHFESLNGFTKVLGGTGAISMYSGGDAIQLETGTTSGSYANLRKGINLPPIQATWNKNRMFHTTVELSDSGAPNVAIGTGYTARLSDGGGNFIGFRFQGKILYARTQTDGTHKTEVVLLDYSGVAFPTSVIRLNVKLFAKERAEFSVHNLKNGDKSSCVITTNLPTGTLSASILLEVYIVNSTTVNGIMALSYVVLVQPE